MICDKCNSEMFCILDWVETDEIHMRRRIRMKCTDCSNEFEWKRTGENK